ncbi:MAG: glycosyltransferase family 4 protein [Gemmatimonadota bacterium]|nr:glycosyltransferase family 4 protein [Gemmatimonadota bacterium]
MTRARKLWVVCEVHDPEPSTGFYVARIAEDLARDRDVRVITRRGTGQIGVTEAEPKLILLGPPQRKSTSPLLRIADGLRFSAAACAYLLRHIRSCDTVLAVTNPPVLPHLVGAAVRLRGASLVVLLHDVYPELLAELGLIRRQSYVMRIFTHAALRLQQRAAVNVVLGRDMRRKLEDRADAATRGNIRVITNWADVEGVYPDQMAGFDARRKWGLSDEFVVLFAGNMGRTHDLELLLAAAERLKNDDGIRFVLVGRGARFDQVANAIHKRNLSNVLLLPPCGYADLSAYLNAADVYLIPMRPRTRGLSVPSRLYNAMAAGRPIIAVADPDSELAMVVSEEGAGRVVAPGDIDALVDTVLHLRDAPPERECMGRAARRAAESRYTREHAKRAWRELLDGLEHREPLTGGRR